MEEAAAHLPYGFSSPNICESRSTSKLSVGRCQLYIPPQVAAAGPAAHPLGYCKSSSWSSQTSSHAAQASANDSTGTLAALSASISAAGGSGRWSAGMSCARRRKYGLRRATLLLPRPAHRVAVDRMRHWRRRPRVSHFLRRLASLRFRLSSLRKTIFEPTQEVRATLLQESLDRTSSNRCNLMSRMHVEPTYSRY